MAFTSELLVRLCYFILFLGYVIYSYYTVPKYLLFR